MAGSVFFGSAAGIDKVLIKTGRGRSKRIVISQYLPSTYLCTGSADSERISVITVG